MSDQVTFKNCPACNSTHVTRNGDMVSCTCGVEAYAGKWDSIPRRGGGVDSGLERVDVAGIKWEIGQLTNRLMALEYVEGITIPPDVTSAPLGIQRAIDALAPASISDTQRLNWLDTIGSNWSCGELGLYRFGCIETSAPGTCGIREAIDAAIADWNQRQEESNESTRR